MIDRLTKRSEQIAAFPRSGRMVPEYEAPDIREVIERPYRIIYRIATRDPAVTAVIADTELLWGVMPWWISEDLWEEHLRAPDYH